MKFKKDYFFYLKSSSLLLAFLFFSINSESQISDVGVLFQNSVVEEFDMDSTRVRFTSLPNKEYLNGYQNIIYSDGSYSIIRFDNGYPDGKWILNNKKGKTERVTDYKGGKKHGKEIYFYPSGTKKLMSNFLNGFQEGITEMFYSTGVKGGEFFSVKGKKQGIETWTDEIYGKTIYKAYYLENEKVDSLYYFTVLKLNK